ncbi:hypothetical protein HPPN135_04175 [Helicobacter pylori Puno135]|nr:hypothetical protein HPPN135_04175 [Helicobacter pylori Puno135]
MDIFLINDFNVFGFPVLKSEIKNRIFLDFSRFSLIVIVFISDELRIKNLPFLRREMMIIKLF